MAKGRKGRTFRKKMKGGLEPGKPELEPELEQKLKPTYPVSVVDISKIPGQAQAPPKPVSLVIPSNKNISDNNLYADYLMGGKLRRTRKRRMTKRRKNSRKSRKSKSRKMRGGIIENYLPSFFKRGQEKNQENSYFQNKPVEEKINRIEERNNNPQVGEINNEKPLYDNITNFSDEYIKLMLQNIGKYDYKKANKDPIRL
jgi:hypothetical protein